MEEDVIGVEGVLELKKLDMASNGRQGKQVEEVWAEGADDRS